MFSAARVISTQFLFLLLPSTEKIFRKNRLLAECLPAKKVRA